MKKLIKWKWFPMVAVIAAFAVVVLVMALLGFRITYAPDLENSWEAISAVAAWAGVITSIAAVGASFAAVWFAIRVPKEIAEQQNKIALFEKRYRVYREICRCSTFSYMLKLANEPEDARMIFLVSFEKESMVDMTIEELNKPYWIRKILISSQKLSEILRETEFLFADYPEIFEYTEKIVTAMVKLYSPLTNNEEFAKYKQQFISIMNEEDYEKVLSQMNKELQLKRT